MIKKKLKQGFREQNLEWKDDNVTWCMVIINQDKIDQENGKD